MYTEKVMDHFQHPRNVGEIENASGVGTVGNAKCGDIMRIYLDIDENQIIRDVKFKTFGCGAAVATSSMATELVKGKNIQEAMQVTNKAVMEALDGLPPVKVHCSLLAEEAIHAALWDYAEKNGIKIEGLEKPKPLRRHPWRSRTHWSWVLRLRAASGQNSRIFRNLSFFTSVENAF